MWLFISYAAAVLTTAAYVPQVIKVFTTKSTAGISLWMYMVIMTGVTLWAVYGIYKNDWAIILANFLTLAMAIVIFVCKIINIKTKGEKP